MCNRIVQIRKEEVEGTPRFHVEGILSEDYFKIRDLLYSQYNIL